MKKIPTVFKKDPNNLGRVIDEINPGCEWVFTDGILATRKFDGTAAAVDDGLLYKRYDVKKGREVPEGAIPCQEPDAITGHWPHWVKVDFSEKENRWFLDAWNQNNGDYDDGTYELIGPKIQGNPEGWFTHALIKHGSETIDICFERFSDIKLYLQNADIEGIVFHHRDGRMAKIRKSDFGFKRTPKTKV